MYKQSWVKSKKKGIFNKRGYQHLKMSPFCFTCAEGEKNEEPKYSLLETSSTFLWLVHDEIQLFFLKVIQTNVMRLRAWLICHTFSSSYSSKASWNWAGVKPRETQRCSASAIRTTPPAPLRPATPSVASSRTREKITSDGLWALDRKSSLHYTLGGEKKKKLACVLFERLICVYFHWIKVTWRLQVQPLKNKSATSNVSWQLTVVRPSCQCRPTFSRNWLLWKQLHKHLGTFTASSGIYSYSYRCRNLIKRLWIGWNPASPCIHAKAERNKSLSLKH